MSGEDFLLKWNDHHRLFFAGAEELCQNEEYTDVTLAAGARLFPAHRLVLSVCSPYFRQLFQRLGTDKPVIYLKDVESRHMELLLNYMYKGEINVEEHELVTVLNTAQGLEIQGLSQPGKSKDGDPSVKMEPPQAPVTKAGTSPQSVSKKRKFAATKTPVFFNVPAVNPVEDPIPSIPDPIDIVKEEVLHDVEEWNNGAEYEGYEEGVYYQDDGTDHNELNKRQLNNALFNDMATVVKDKKFVPKCDQCDYQPTQSGSLSRHKQAVHEGVRHPCKQCDDTFAAKASLRRHVLCVHEGFRYTCKLCYYNTTKKTYLNKHMISLHGQQL